MPSRTSQVRLQVLDAVHHTQTLLIVSEAQRAYLVQRAFARVAERRVTEVVSERDRFGQVLVQAQRPRDRARDLRDLERVRQPRAVVVALRAK